MELTNKAITSTEFDIGNFDTDSFTNKFMGWFKSIRKNTSTRNSFIKLFANELDNRFTRCRFRSKYKTNELREEISSIQIIMHNTLMESTAKFDEFKFLPAELISQEKKFVEKYYLTKLDTIYIILNELTEGW